MAGDREVKNVCSAPAGGMQICHNHCRPGTGRRPHYRDRSWCFYQHQTLLWALPVLDKPPSGHRYCARLFQTLGFKILMLSQVVVTLDNDMQRQSYPPLVKCQRWNVLVSVTKEKWICKCLFVKLKQVLISVRFCTGCVTGMHSSHTKTPTVSTNNALTDELWA